MPVFDFTHYTDASIINDNPFKGTCVYCKEKLNVLKIKDSWKVSKKRILEIHAETRKNYKELHGLEDCYLNLELNDPEINTYIEYCKCCGWWRLLKHIYLPAEAWQIWNMVFGCVGILKSFDLLQSNESIQEVRSYLTAKYDARFYIHPKVFEDVVGSVFKSLGYQTLVTGYSNDGGIDIILNGSSDLSIGIQVKRYRNKITVENIRAFAGALILNGHQKGLYITTSDYQSGVIDTVKRFKNKTIPIELVNANRFYDALKIAQKKDFDISNIMQLFTKNYISEIYYYGWNVPMNSL